MRQRWAVSGLAVLAALTFGAAGCSSGSGTAASPTTASKSGIDVLSAAAAKVKGQSYQFSVVDGSLLSATGATSGDGNATTLTINLGNAGSGAVIKADGIVLTDAAYVKVDLGALGGLAGLGNGTQWLHLDLARAPGAARLGIRPGQDTFGPQTYVNGVVTATVTSPTQITGTLDIAKAAPPGVASTEAAKLSAAQRVVPFTATLDTQGRLTKMVATLPTIGVAPAGDLTATWSGWGTPVTAAKPASVLEAPDLLYAFLT